MLSMDSKHGIKNLLQKKLIVIFFEIPIEEMNLSGRAYNCLMRAGLTTVGKVKMLAKEDLLNMKNMGQTAANEIICKLKNYD